MFWKTHEAFLVGFVLLCCAILCCAVLYFAVLCCAILRCAVLYCAVLYCDVLCCAVPVSRLVSSRLSFYHPWPPNPFHVQVSHPIHTVYRWRSWPCWSWCWTSVFPIAEFSPTTVSLAERELSLASIMDGLTDIWLTCCYVNAAFDKSALSCCPGYQMDGITPLGALTLFFFLGT